MALLFERDEQLVPDLRMETIDLSPTDIKILTADVMKPALLPLKTPTPITEASFSQFTGLKTPTGLTPSASFGLDGPSFAAMFEQGSSTGPLSPIIPPNNTSSRSSVAEHLGPGGSNIPKRKDYVANKTSLPPTHKPARGRGRKHQLQMMTKEQIAEEAAQRAEKNRLAARECRMRRKNRETQLKQRVEELEAEKRAADKRIEQLLARIRLLESQAGR